MANSILPGIVTSRARAGMAARISIPHSVALAGRTLIAGLFLTAGVSKIGSYVSTALYMESFGVPSVLLPTVIALEVLGALALVAGWRTGVVALVLAGFTLLATLVFHNDLSDSVQQAMLLRNISIIGGLLVLATNGPGALSIDQRSRPGVLATEQRSSSA